MINVLIIDKNKDNRIKIRSYVNQFKDKFKIIANVKDTSSAEVFINNNKIDLIVGEFNEELSKLFGMYKNRKKYFRMIVYNESNKALGLTSSSEVIFIKPPLSKSKFIATLASMSEIIISAKNKKIEQAMLAKSFENEQPKIYQNNLVSNFYYLMGEKDNNESMYAKVALYYIPDTTSNSTYNLFLASSIFRKNLNGKYEIIIISNNTIAIIFTEKTYDHQIIDDLNIILRRIYSFYKIKGVVGIGRSYDDQLSIHKSYYEAKYVIQSYSHSCDNSVIDIKYIIGKNEIPLSSISRIEEVLVSSIINGKFEMMNDAFSEIRVLLINSSNPELISDRIVSYIKLFFNLRYDNIKYYSFKATKNNEPAKHLEELRNFVNNLRKEIYKREQEQDEKLIDNMIKYVVNNFNARINISEIAKDLNTTPNKLEYITFSRFNKTFYEYFLYVRIENIKKMLTSTDKSIAEISKDCGFLSEAYFVALFKKQVGKTPAEYRFDNNDEANLRVVSS